MLCGAGRRMFSDVRPTSADSSLKKKQYSLFLSVITKMAKLENYLLLNPERKGCLPRLLRRPKKVRRRIRV